MPDQRPEAESLTRQRAHEVAIRFCQEHPDRMAFIYAEIRKRDGFMTRKSLAGQPRIAVRTETVAQVLGRAYRGPKPRSTMMRKGRGGIPDLPTIRPGARTQGKGL